MENKKRSIIAKEMALIGRKKKWLTVFNSFLIGLVVGIAINEGVVHFASGVAQAHCAIHHKETVSEPEIL